MKVHVRNEHGQLVPLEILTLKGERGLDGAQGVQGPQGPQGDKGDKGDKGEQGESGVYVGSKDSAPASARIIVDNSSDGMYLNQVVTVPIIDSVLNLTANKAQTTIMKDETTIVLPEVKEYTEIHLFFYTESDLTLILPNIKWQSQPTIEANKKYELIFTHETEWLGGCICYE